MIVAVAQRLPERVVQEDSDLLMYYDNASMRMESKCATGLALNNWPGCVLCVREMRS